MKIPFPSMWQNRIPTAFADPIAIGCWEVRRQIKKTTNLNMKIPFPSMWQNLISSAFADPIAIGCWEVKLDQKKRFYQ